MPLDPTKLLSKDDLLRLKKLSTPIKIQDFLDTLPMNHEKNGETYMSVSRVFKEKTAHCFEGALLAACALWLQGEKPLLLDLKVMSGVDDVDHVVALYKINGLWGAISKTNHASLRFRDPIYKTIRELVCSYFHEYFLNSTGQKTLRTYSKPFDLSKNKFVKKINWISSEKELDDLVQALDDSPHFEIVPKKNLKFLRKADDIELKSGKLVEWGGKRSPPRPLASP